MRIFEQVSQDDEFLSFIDQNIKGFYTLNREKKELLENFHTLKSVSLTSGGTYDDKELMLLAWPKFVVKNPPDIIINLCNELTKRPRSYNRLLECREFGRRKQLDKVLGQLEKLGLLIINESTSLTTRI